MCVNLTPPNIVVAATGDQHGNSTLGLCPEEGVRLDDGGRYLPNKVQLWLWANWIDYWDTVERTVREHKAKLICLFNGDAHDGNHHGTTQIISANEEVQAYVAQRIFGVPKALKPIKTYWNRGTEVHVGPSGSSEENLARWFHAEKDPETEAWSSWHWRFSIYGRVFDTTHHCSMGGRPWTEQNAAVSLAAQVMMEYTRRDERPPDLVFRSHVHRTADSGPAFDQTRAVILPAWQMSTGYGHKVAPNRLPDIGGGIAVIGPDGDYEYRTKKYKPTMPPIVKAA